MFVLTNVSDRLGENVQYINEGEVRNCEFFVFEQIGLVFVQKNGVCFKHECKLKCGKNETRESESCVQILNKCNLLKEG